MKKHAVVDYDSIVKKLVFYKIIIRKQFAATGEFGFNNLNILIIIKRFNKIFIAVIINDDNFFMWIKSPKALNTIILIFIG